MVADVRHSLDNLLAPELKNDPEGPVGTGVLGAQVQEEEVLVALVPLEAPQFGVDLQRLLLGILLLRRQGVRTHLRAPGNGPRTCPRLPARTSWRWARCRSPWAWRAHRP